MDGVSPAYFLIAINATLVGAVAFFMRQLVGRFERMEASISELNKNLAVVVTKQDHYSDKLHSIDETGKRFDGEIKSIRERLHVYGNELNGVVMRHELLEEKFENCKHKRHA